MFYAKINRTRKNIANLKYHTLSTYNLRIKKKNFHLNENSVAIIRQYHVRSQYIVLFYYVTNTNPLFNNNLKSITVNYYYRNICQKTYCVFCALYKIYFVNNAAIGLKITNFNRFQFNQVQRI